MLQKPSFCVYKGMKEVIIAILFFLCAILPHLARKKAFNKGFEEGRQSGFDAGYSKGITDTFRKKSVGKVKPKEEFSWVGW